MRLIACQNCHAQFDVTDVTDEKIVCRCGTAVENCAPDGIDAVVHRCGSCGGQVESDAAECDYCGANITFDSWKLSLICPECCARNSDDSRFCMGCGVAFNPEPLCDSALEYPCPVCSCLMPARRLGSVPINECPQCNGLWVREGLFDQLVNSALEARKTADPETLAAYEARVKGGNPARQKVAYRKCPECDGFMLRRNFQKSSGVITDICNSHGTWLDADELEQIVGFVLSGGRPQSTARLEEDEVKARQAYVSASLSGMDGAAFAATKRARSYERSRSHDKNSSGSEVNVSLLGLLKTLLD